ncbi:MAG: glycosyltransferase [Acidobacteriota bacterium]
MAVLDVIDVSVVIATYRRPAELVEAARSALDQHGPSLEVLIVDDCPGGSAFPAVQALRDERITYFQMKHPTGGSPATVRNAAWPLARGRFVHFLDDGDIVPVGHYDAATRAFEGDPGAGVVFGQIEPFGTDESALRRERQYFERAHRRAIACQRFGPRWALAATMLFDPAPFVCSAAMIRRECISPINGFDAEVALVDDVDFYSRAIRRFGASVIDHTTLLRRTGPVIEQPNSGPVLAKSYGRMRAKYRTQWGAADYYAAKGFARTVLKVV